MRMRVSFARSQEVYRVMEWLAVLVQHQLFLAVASSYGMQLLYPRPGIIVTKPI